MTILNPPQITSYFSQTVALSGDGACVFANSFTENGTVFAFYYDGTRWIEKKEIFYPGLLDLPIGEYEGFGVTSALNAAGDTAAIGSLNGAWIYKKITGTWNLSQSLQPQNYILLPMIILVWVLQ